MTCADRPRPRSASHTASKPRRFVLLALRNVVRPPVAASTTISWSVVAVNAAKFRRCVAVVVAWPRGMKPLPKGVAPRIATKYTNLARLHFAAKGTPAEIIHLHGSIEVAPSLGLADGIVDITETGETLKANGLVVAEEVLAVSARLIVNRVALKLHAERLRRLIDALRLAVGDAGKQGR